MMYVLNIKKGGCFVVKSCEFDELQGIDLLIEKIKEETFKGGISYTTFKANQEILVGGDMNAAGEFFLRVLYLVPFDVDKTRDFDEALKTWPRLRYYFHRENQLPEGVIYFRNPGNNYNFPIPIDHIVVKNYSMQGTGYYLVPKYKIKEYLKMEEGSRPQEVNDIIEKGRKWHENYRRENEEREKEERRDRDIRTTLGKMRGCEYINVQKYIYEFVIRSCKKYKKEIEERFKEIPLLLDLSDAIVCIGDNLIRISLKSILDNSKKEIHEFLKTELNLDRLLHTGDYKIRIKNLSSKAPMDMINKIYDIVSDIKETGIVKHIDKEWYITSPEGKEIFKSLRVFNDTLLQREIRGSKDPCEIFTPRNDNTGMFFGGVRSNHAYIHFLKGNDKLLLIKICRYKGVDWSADVLQYREGALYSGILTPLSKDSHELRGTLTKNWSRPFGMLESDRQDKEIYVVNIETREQKPLVGYDDDNNIIKTIISYIKEELQVLPEQASA